VGALRIDTDRLHAHLVLDSSAVPAVVAAELDELGVVFGLDQVALDRAIADGTDGEPVCIASGTAPVPGRATRVELDFDPEQRIGTLDADSQQVDYRERGGLHSVEVGDRLGIWYPAETGVPGTGVDGEPIEPTSPSAAGVSVGSGIRCDPGADDTLVLFAELAGVVRVASDGTLKVSDLLEIQGDVDLSIGNIDVQGSVHVKGTVRSGFSVHARQDIDVDGMVEDADVSAGDSLRVRMGVVAGQDGVVNARSQIRAKYFQNATVRCRGDVILEADTNSAIESGGTILAREGGGRMRGGTYTAATGLWALELGSALGAETHVRVGKNSELAREMARACSEQALLAGKFKKLQRKCGLDNVKRVGGSLTRLQATAVRAAMKARRDMQKRITLVEHRKRTIEAAMASGPAPFVRVEKQVHAGVQIQIGDAVLSIDRTRAGGIFRRDAETGEITSGS
jgi:uncharacterized protein (DUF342 family)